MIDIYSEPIQGCSAMLCENAMALQAIYEVKSQPSLS